MSVVEYEVKFTQLSHYALAMMATESDRYRHFEEGLQYEIQSKITPGDLRSYTDLRVAAIRAELLIKERQTFFQRPKREGSIFSTGSGVRPSKRHNFSPPAQSFTRGNTFGSRGGWSFNVGNINRSQKPSMQARTTCPHYGRQHLGECRGILGGCYICGERGHFVRDCPKRVNMGQAMSEPTVQNTGTRGAGTFLGRNKGKGVGQSKA